MLFPQKRESRKEKSLWPGGPLAQEYGWVPAFARTAWRPACAGKAPRSFLSATYFDCIPPGRPLRLVGAKHRLEHYRLWEPLKNPENIWNYVNFRRCDRPSRRQRIATTSCVLAVSAAQYIGFSEKSPERRLFCARRIIRGSCNTLAE